MRPPVKYNELHWKTQKILLRNYCFFQRNKCHHCGGDLSQEPPEDITKIPVIEELFPKGFFNYPIHLHHNHDTGMTIGAVHAYCNAVLWMYHGE